MKHKHQSRHHNTWFSRLKNWFKNLFKSTHGHCGFPPHCGLPSGCGFFVVVGWFVFLWLVLTRIWRKPSPAIQSNQTNPKIAYISVYGIPCGISTYNEELIPHLKGCEVKIFAEYAHGNQHEHLPGDPRNLIRCWDRHDKRKSHLIKLIEDYNPDVIHIGHEYGLFPKGYYFTSLLTKLKRMGKPIVVTLHSVYDHIDKVVQEACIPEIICHTKEAKATLEAKGIDTHRIHVIPHGNEVPFNLAGEIELMPDLWNTWQASHTIFQPGFLFAYKGHKRMLEVVARLKETLPDVHYVIQASESPNNMAEHNELHDQLVSEIQRLDIADHVTINRGFVSKQVLLAFIRTSTCCVLPYCNHKDHDVRATSGIARLILTTQTPLVTSNVHLFDDLNKVASKAIDDESLYQLTLTALTDWKVKRDQIMARTEFLKNKSWTSVAEKTVDLYKQLR